MALDIGDSTKKPVDRGILGDVKEAVQADVQAREQELKNARAARIAKLENFWHAHNGTWLRVEEEVAKAIEYPKWVSEPDGPRLVNSAEEEKAA